MGGAYGGFAESGDGSIVFSSFRDPNVANTLNVFNGALNWIQKDVANISADRIEEAKLKTFASLDAPEPPAIRGLKEFFYNLSDEVRQQRRDRLFAASRDQVMEVAQKYLGTERESAVAVFGAQEESQKFKTEGWTVRSE
jgi:Zn-dependent M16 (insulinase) family peptidase